MKSENEIHAVYTHRLFPAMETARSISCDGFDKSRFGDVTYFLKAEPFDTMLMLLFHIPLTETVLTKIGN